MGLSSGVYDIVFTGIGRSKNIFHFDVRCPYGYFNIVYYFDSHKYYIDPNPKQRELVLAIEAKLYEMKFGDLAPDNLGFLIQSNDFF